MSPGFRQQGHRAFEQSSGREAEVYELHSHIDTYGVQSYHFEREGPAAMSLDVYDLVEEAEKAEGIGSDYAYETAAP